MACTTFSLENLHNSPMKCQQIIAHNLRGGEIGSMWRQACRTRGLHVTQPVFQVALDVSMSKRNWELWLGSKYATFHESVYLL